MHDTCHMRILFGRDSDLRKEDLSVLSQIITAIEDRDRIFRLPVCDASFNAYY
ncbi:hypothetical protein PILCRDRAFT_825495 [Piloderma croceum F 1598]|uniref:Uncharacterized protein n=1 Tax=Piloderma croceum (strain F 1598) TaxID=765440 RepID=A0A0C3EXU1_PILCF|nr:hypothetical protein PILCRDRAFT_825495 [Piloderma croceum F 1598]